MNCPKLIVSVLLLSAFSGCTNTTQPEQKTSAKDSSGYVFSVPPKWTTEEFAFPVGFAPQLPYKGMEVLRFAPGWAATASENIGHILFSGGLKDNPHLMLLYFSRTLPIITPVC